MRVKDQMRVYCIWLNACRISVKCVSYIVIRHAFGQVKNVAYRPKRRFSFLTLIWFELENFSD